MKEIKLLTEHIADELDDAETYAQLALDYKEADPETAALFLRLSDEELTHMDALHNAAAKLVGKHRREKGEPPAAMTAVYDFLHKRQIERVKEIKILQSMMRGG